MITSHDQYRSAITAKRFEEFPKAVGSGMTTLKSFVDFSNADLDLKIHLTTVVLNRNFSSFGTHMVLSDQFWLIEQFLKDYENDLLRPWMGKAVREAMQMITSEHTFTKGILGTGFMFGIVEYYAKHMLGWRPFDYNEFDSYHIPFREMTIGEAITKLKKTNTVIAKSLNRIDKLSMQRFREWGCPDNPHIRPEIADRLTYCRNSMLHGESHSHYSIGAYLCVLYILFHYCQLKTIDNSLGIMPVSDMMAISERQPAINS